MGVFEISEKEFFLSVTGEAGLDSQGAVWDDPALLW
jgi:uncharacterized protein (DUF2342 family)